MDIKLNVRQRVLQGKINTADNLKVSFCLLLVAFAISFTMSHCRFNTPFLVL